MEQQQQQVVPGIPKSRKRFLLTLDVDLHRRLKAQAANSGMTMSAWIITAIQGSLDREAPGDPAAGDE